MLPLTGCKWITQGRAAGRPVGGDKNGHKDERAEPHVVETFSCFEDAVSQV